MAVIVVDRGARARLEADPAFAEFGQARVGRAVAVGVVVEAAPAREYARVACVDRHVATQAIQLEPRGERLGVVRRDVEQILAAALMDDHVEHVLALRAEQPGIERQRRGEVGGQQALEEVARVGTADAKDGTVGEAGGRHRGLLVLFALSTNPACLSRQARPACAKSVLAWRLRQG